MHVLQARLELQVLEEALSLNSPHLPPDWRTATASRTNLGKRSTCHTHPHSVWLQFIDREAAMKLLGVKDAHQPNSSFSMTSACVTSWRIMQALH